MSQPICPECAVGKCGSCAGFALDEHDDFTDCACTHDQSTNHENGSSDAER